MSIHIAHIEIFADENQRGKAANRYEYYVDTWSLTHQKTHLNSGIAKASAVNLIAAEA